MDPGSEAGMTAKDFIYNVNAKPALQNTTYLMKITLNSAFGAYLSPTFMTPL